MSNRIEMTHFQLMKMFTLFASSQMENVDIQLLIDKDYENENSENKYEPYGKPVTFSWIVKMFTIGLIIVDDFCLTPDGETVCVYCILRTGSDGENYVKGVGFEVSSAMINW